MIRRILCLFAAIAISASAQEPVDLSKLFAKSDDSFLEVDQAFAISPSVFNDEVIISYEVAPTYYLYQHRLKAEVKQVTFAQIDLPEGKQKVDEYFGEVQIYTKQLQFGLPVTPANQAYYLALEFQGCAEAGLCYPPTRRFFAVDPENKTSHKIEESEYDAVSSEIMDRWVGPELKQDSPVGTKGNTTSPDSSKALAENSSGATIKPFKSEKSQIIDTLNESSILFGFLFLIALGIGLAFTPCVFPMMPIISSIIAGQGDKITLRRSFLLSIIYTQAMAIPYVIIGFIVAGVGAGATATLQSPPFVIGSAVVFLILSLGMFGFFEIQLPSSMQNSLNNISNRQQGGTYIGAAIMGVISGAVVSPCVTIPLIAVLTWISQVGEALTGGIYLYGLALGMGIPLIIIGVGGGQLLPNAGSWMNAVKATFGVMMIGVALYITKHLIPGPVYLLLWGVLLIICSIYMGALSSLESAATGWDKLWKGVGVVALIYGATLLIGASQGSTSLISPLAAQSTHAASAESKSTPATGHNDSIGHNGFILIKSSEDLDRYLAQAKAEGKTVMLDFFAEYCAACYEFAELTFPDPLVQKALANTILLQADVTAGDAADLALMSRFKIIGLPSILFFDQGGREITSLRAEGFEDAETFALRIEAAFDL